MHSGCFVLLLNTITLTAALELPNTLPSEPDFASLLKNV